MSKSDPFSGHEALHTVYLLTEMFSRHVIVHPFMQANSKLAAQADEIGDALGALYQAIGQLQADV